jgi:hypothetical protein
MEEEMAAIEVLMQLNRMPSENALEGGAINGIERLNKQ